jgi:dGTPase
VRDGIGIMVGDVLQETERRVRESGVQTIEDVRNCGVALAGFSAELAAEERQLKRLLYERLYNSEALTPVRKEAQRVITGLAQFYLENPQSLPEGWQRGEGEVARQRGIADYIAGMTDRFAIARHEELVGPVHLPDRF